MKKNTKNLFLHADGDSFFVACELTKRPELKGQPVIVGEDRGIAVAMSPEAKKLGVTRGMPIFQIKKLFPQVVILPHHFDLYQDIASRMQQILLSYSVTIEAYSIDECFALIEPSDVVYFGGEKKLLTELKDEIEKTLGVTYSLGLGRTKALAKQASKLYKPGGLVILASEADEARALQATPIDDVWGIGRKTAPILRNLGIKTAHDFVSYPSVEIINNFSKPLAVLQQELSGEPIFEVCNNVDPRDQKSIQSTSTFRPASSSANIIWREIAENAEQACANARAVNLVSNKISFFVKTNKFKYYLDEAKLSFYTSDPGEVLKSIEPRLPKLLKNKESIRSTGVILHNLMREEDTPRDLFGHQDKALGDLIVEKTADKIRQKFGHDAIKRASSLKRKS